MCVIPSMVTVLAFVIHVKAYTLEDKDVDGMVQQLKSEKTDKVEQYLCF